MNLERIRYLREFVERHKHHANQPVGGPSCFSTHDTLELLAAAEVLARLEAWMLGDGIDRTVELARDPTGKFWPILFIGGVHGTTERAVADGPRCDNLCTALTKALDEAERA